MAIVDKTIDDLIAMEAKLGESISFEEAFPIYAAKRRLEETLNAAQVEINRLLKGWTWAQPPRVQSHGGQQCVTPPVREELQRSPVTSARRFVPTG
jgi:hypothetical protein